MEKNTKERKTQPTADKGKKSEDSEIKSVAGSFIYVFSLYF